MVWAIWGKWKKKKTSEFRLNFVWVDGIIGCIFFYSNFKYAGSLHTAHMFRSVRLKVNGYFYLLFYSVCVSHSCGFIAHKNNTTPTNTSGSTSTRHFSFAHAELHAHTYAQDTLAHKYYSNCETKYRINAIKDSTTELNSLETHILFHL